MAPSSTAYSSLYATAGTLDLGDNNASGIGDTDYSHAMTALTSTVPNSGNGSAGNPQQFVFLMTDGVQDVWAQNFSGCPSGTVGWNGSHCTQAFDPSTCSGLKNKNVTIGVIVHDLSAYARGEQLSDTCCTICWQHIQQSSIVRFPWLVLPSVGRKRHTSSYQCLIRKSDWAWSVNAMNSDVAARAVGGLREITSMVTFRARFSRSPLQSLRFKKDQRGAAAIEFALIALPFLAIICAIFELGFVNFQNEMLANAVTDAARAMMTGRLQTANVQSSQQFISQYLCQSSGRSLPSNFNCSNLIVDVRSAASFAAGDTANDFYKSSGNVFCPGQPGQVVVLRVAYPLQAILPVNLFSRSAGVVSDMPNVPGNFHILMSAALFEEENYSGSYTSPSGC